MGVDAFVFFSLALSRFLNYVGLFIFLNKAAESRIDTGRLPDFGKITDLPTVAMKEVRAIRNAVGPDPFR